MRMPGQLDVKRRVRVVFHALRLTYHNPMYLILTLAVAIFFVAFTNLLLNFSLILTTLQDTGSAGVVLHLLYLLFMGIPASTDTPTLLSESSMGLLIGVNVSFIIYSYNRHREASLQAGGAGAAGTIIGMITAGCASCSLSILSLFGVVGGLGFLPYQGYEVLGIGILVLIAAIYWSANSVLGICNVRPGTGNG